MPRKNKKRARSSSPVPPPSQDDPRFDSNKTELTTPQADPAMELWSRYTSNKGTPSANKSVAFAHLINESSPHSTAAAGSVSGLRRWASCGHEFPASHRKRRRTHGVFQGEKDPSEDVFANAPSSEGVMQGQSTKPSIASMVQRMRECVSKPQSRISTQIPSSSSPAVGAGDRLAPSSGSPLQRRLFDQGQENDLEHDDQDQEIPEKLHAEEDTVCEGVYVDDEPQCEESIQYEQPHKSPASSDDFGDDDFDSDMVEALDTTPPTAEDSAPLTSFPNLTTELVKSQSQPQSQPHAPSQPQWQPPNAATLQAAGSDDDEFGMDDGEDFAADLEHMASLYDTRSMEPSRNDPVSAEENIRDLETASAVAFIDLVKDDEDDFGEDIDVDEFAAAEVAATQGPSSTVCRTRTHPP